MADAGAKVKTVYACDLQEWIGVGFLGLLFVAVAAALLWGSIAIASSSRSSGSPDYCMVLMGAESGVAPTFRLWAHRPWSYDKQLAVFTSFNEAAAASERIGCPFRASP